MADRITIRRPDDWHIHLRDGAMLKAVLPHTARVFARGIAMPNLAHPVETVADAVAYRDRILAALPKGQSFTPLMTCYLTHGTDPDEVERGFREGVFTGVKLYPAHATTNSAEGVTDLAAVSRVFERMEKIGMPLLMHGEEVDPAIDIFDREAVFIDRRLGPLARRFPGLKMIMEHLTTKVAVDFVRAMAPQIAGTLTPHHLEFSRNDWIGAGLKPFLYCQPVIKTAADRRALREAAASGDPCFFLGTDSAPHPTARKLTASAASGVFAAPTALESYVRVFDEEGALDKLEAFASLNGPRHYGLPPNEDTITLERRDWTEPSEVGDDGPEAAIPVYRGGETIPWRVVAAS